MNAYFKGEPVFGPQGPAQNVYSTKETCIGTWVDGKPLYRKVFYFQDIKTATLTSIKVADCSDMDVGEVISISGSYSFNTDPRKWRLGGHYTDAFFRDGSLYLYNFYNATNTFYGFIWLEYTKTTD